MRHPFVVGAFVLAALLLSFAALLHLLVARRRNGARLLWAGVVLFVPVLGPVLYVWMGRAQGAFEDEEELEEEAEASVFAPDAYVSPARAALPDVRPPRERGRAVPDAADATPRAGTVAAPVRGARALPPPSGDEKTPPTIVPDESLPLPRIAPVRRRAPLPPSEERP